MRRIAVALLFLIAFMTPQAHAATHSNLGVGFHTHDAPIGFRYWFGEEQKLAFDAGIGFHSTEVGDERLTDFFFDFGIPILIKGWERAHAAFRPGLLWNSDAFISGVDTERANNMSIMAELEAEVFVTENFTVSASHGVAIDIPDGDDAPTTFRSIGEEVTEVGFHLYGLFGE